MGTNAPDDFDEVFNRLFPVAYRASSRILGSGAAAEDVAADTMAKLVVGWRRLSSHPALEAWTVRVAANAAIDVARRRGRNVPHDAAPEEGHALGSADRLALLEALRSLPRRQREAVVLRYLTDLSEADVAAAMSVSVGSVKQLARRGLAGLRTQLADFKEPLHV